jgi:hypothetical protein
MATQGSRDFVVCYFCANEATKAVTVTREGETSRRWVCAYHAERLPRRRRRWLTRIASLRP